MKTRRWTAGFAPIAVGRLEDEFRPGGRAHEAIGAEPDGVLLKARLAHLLGVRFGHDPPRPADQGGVDREEVGPGRVEHDAHVVGVEDFDGLHLLVQQRGEDPLVAPEAEGARPPP